MNYYLSNFSYKDQLLKLSPKVDLGIVVVIPCSNETNLNKTLKSLLDCKETTCSVEVIVVINASNNSSEDVIKINLETLYEANKFLKNNTSKKIDFYFIEENQLPHKDAGVGLARKIGMDEAVRRFEYINNHEGVILCFDADALCETNYLVEVEKHFQTNRNTPACSINFEHPTTGEEFAENIYEGIIQYELHLRVYKNALSYIGLPYAFHTIGSSMAVRSNAYQKQNGMNKRKAGEDFYFLQKLIPLGGFTEINTTKVIPSPRISDRVPFGTGRAMQQWVNEESDCIFSYHPNSYQDLKIFCNKLPQFYTSSNIEIPDSVSCFLESINWQGNLVKIRNNSTSEKHFEKLFYNWFNAFKVLKYMHFARDNYYNNISVFEAGNELLKLLDYPVQNNNLALLESYRGIDKGII